MHMRIHSRPHGNLYCRFQQDRLTMLAAAGHDGVADPSAGHSFSGTGFRQAVLCIFGLLFVLGITSAQAQTSAVCSDTPAPGERIECTEDDTSTSDIDIDAVDIDISTSGDSEPGIKAHHDGDGGINVRAKATDANGPGAIETTGDQAAGIYSLHLGSGRNSIDVSSLGIVTEGSSSHGIAGQHSGSAAGDLEIDVGHVVIRTTGPSSQGVRGLRHREGAGNIDIGIRDTVIETAGRSSFGIYASAEGGTESRRLAVRMSRTAITTMGDLAHGIWARNETSGGKILVDAEDVSITTNGLNAHGIYSYCPSDGCDISISLRNVDVTTSSTALHPDFQDTFSNGVYARGLDDIDIDIRGGSVNTKGAYSYGVYGNADGNGGRVLIETDGDNVITTTGEHAHGIVAYHRGTSQDTSLISVSVGGGIDVSGAGAQGIRVGIVNADGESERVAAIGADGYRRQTVRVYGSVTSAAEGVFISGGGKVVIGPQGTIASGSGIAIRATGDMSVLDDNGDPTGEVMNPRLRIDMHPGSRRVAQIIGDDWIINDGGETTVAVNNVVLHDGATGVTGRTAYNGAWNIRMVEEGVDVTDYTDSDPVNWITEPSGAVGRDFSAADFLEEYAPRAAVYEALSGFLVRLSGGGVMEQGFSSSDSSAWVRLSGKQDSYEAERASVGAEYDFRQFMVSAGLDVSLYGNTAGSISVRHVQGSADVAAPTGGGRIGTDGLGVALGLSLTGSNAWYAKGGLAHMSHTVGLSSDELGRLKSGVKARAYALDLEVGRRMGIRGKVDLIPRTRLARSGVDVDGFTDTVGSRVSMDDDALVTGSLGIVAEKAQAWNWRDGKLSLRGSLDLERVLDGSQTMVDVSGERLSSESAGDRFLLGLGGTYRRDHLSLGAAFSAVDPDSGDAHYVARITFGWGFRSDLSGAQL